mmetsp:Transcript_156085/g.275828  ORF Transcript_156085/g.275828 Transcript_156085/m.275828 type:complete len:99 (+) Transcript_156085:182-478(+)
MHLHVIWSGRVRDERTVCELRRKTVFVDICKGQSAGTSDDLLVLDCAEVSTEASDKRLPLFGRFLSAGCALFGGEIGCTTCEVPREASGGGVCASSAA